MKSGCSCRTRFRMACRSRTSSALWRYATNDSCRDFTFGAMEACGPKNSCRMLLSTPTTSHPASFKRRAHAEPTSPPDPVIKAFILIRIYLRAATIASRNCAGTIGVHVPSCRNHAAIAPRTETTLLIRGKFRPLFQVKHLFELPHHLVRTGPIKGLKVRRHHLLPPGVDFFV